MRPEVHTTPTNHANRLLRPGRLARSRLRLSVRRFAAAARADGHYDPPGCDLGRLLHHRRSLGASGPWSFEGGERQPIATAAARDARQNVLGVGQGVHGTHGGGWAGCQSGRRGCRAVGPHGGSWRVALSASLGGMSVEMAVESPTDMMVRGNAPVVSPSNTSASAGASASRSPSTPTPPSATSAADRCTPPRPCIGGS